DVLVLAVPVAERRGQLRLRRLDPDLDAPRRRLPTEPDPGGAVQRHGAIAVVGERARRAETEARVVRACRAAALIPRGRPASLLEAPVGPRPAAHARLLVVVRRRELLPEQAADRLRLHAAVEDAVRVRLHGHEPLPALRREALDRDAPRPAPRR